MATKKPKVGDPAIIDGTPGQVVDVNAKGIEIHDEERLAARAYVEEVRAMTPAKARAAKDAFEKNPRPGGTAHYAAHARVMWVEYSKVWSLHGRLLSRTADSETGRSVWSRARLRRIAGEPYDPSIEISAHIAATIEGGN